MTADAKLLADLDALVAYMTDKTGKLPMPEVCDIPGTMRRAADALRRYVPTPPLTTPPSGADEKILRRMTKHEAIHELEGQCCVIARACCSLTNLDALTLAGFDIPETQEIMKLAGAVIERAKAIHDKEFISL